MKRIPFKNLSVCIVLFAGLFMTAQFASAAGRGNGAILNQITDNYTTPHLDWGKPLAGGALKVLFIVPRKSAREVVELGERIDIDRQAVVAHNSTNLAVNNVYEALIDGTSVHEKSQELLDKIDGQYGESTYTGTG